MRCCYRGRPGAPGGRPEVRVWPRRKEGPRGVPELRSTVVSCFEFMKPSEQRGREGFRSFGQRLCMLCNGAVGQYDGRSGNTQNNTSNWLVVVLFRWDMFANPLATCPTSNSVHFPLEEQQNDALSIMIWFCSDGSDESRNNVYIYIYIHIHI